MSMGICSSKVDERSTSKETTLRLHPIFEHPHAHFHIFDDAGKPKRRVNI